MTSWKKYEATGIAIFPYASQEPFHLKLQSGDQLEISEKCGEWVKARCVTSSCIGICPLNRIQLYQSKDKKHRESDDDDDSDHNSQDSFDLLSFESKNLFKYIFSRVICQTRHADENDAHILNQIMKAISFLHISNDGKTKIEQSQRPQIAECLDNIRESIQLNKLERGLNSNVLRTHDITEKIFPSKAPPKVVKMTASYDTQIQISVFFSINYKEDLRISFRLYSLSKKEIISAPADVFLRKNSNKEQRIKFINVNANLSDDLILISRVMVNYRMAEKKAEKGLILSEYIGVGAQKLNFSKDNNETEINFQLYKGINEVLPSDIAPKLLDSKDNRTDIIKVDDFPKMTIKYSLEKTVDAALNADRNDLIPTIKLPHNMTPDFSINRLYVHINKLKHKSKKKKTRINLRVLDKSQGKFIECFLNTQDRTLFPTVVQKGILQMPIDEIAEITFPTECDINNLYIIFEVIRIISDGTTHLSSFSIWKITGDDGLIRLPPFGKEEVLILRKPDPPNMNASNFTAFIEAHPKWQEDPTASDVSVKFNLCSTIISSEPAIYKIIHWEQYESEVALANFKLAQIDDDIFSVFLLQILHNIFEIILSDKDDLTKAGFIYFIQTLSIIDRNMRSSGQLKILFDYFVDNCFTPERPEYANIYSHLFQYIISALPDHVTNKLEGEADTSCKDCCRCLSYILSLISSSLKLNKEVDGELNDKQFQKDIENIFIRLAIIIQMNTPMMKVSQTFVCRAFSTLCDIISSSFSNDELLSLVLNFFKQVESALYQNDNNMVYLILGLIDTQLFANEENRKELMPIVIKHVMTMPKQSDKNEDQKAKQQAGKIEEKYMSDRFDIVRASFFVLMKTSSCLPVAIAPLSEFVEKLIPKSLKAVPIESNKNQYFFDLIYIYFCNTKTIEDLILSNENKLTFFNNLLDMIQEIVKSTPPSYIFYICTITFIKLVSFSSKEQFHFLHQQVDKLIDLISSFYNVFLKASNAIKEYDRPFYSRIYLTDLEPIAALLPQLLNSVPEESRFNSSVILPLFHFYVNQPDEKTRKSVTHGFYLLLQSDYKQSKNFTRSENASIPALDKVSGYENMLDLKILIKDTKEKFSQTDQQNEVVKSFFKRLDELLTYMRDLGSLPNEHLYEDERATAILSVLDACQKENMFLIPHFTSKLYELHMMMGNKTEAAEALMECARFLSWDDHTAVAEGHGQPEQEKRERKRKIMHEAVNLFMQTQFFERALDVLGQLEEFYKNIEICYEDLSKVYKLESDCYDSICNQERNILNRFYGVRFYGAKFSEYFKDTLFIYRRDGFFMNDKMMMNLKEKFPDAEVSPKAPTEDALKNNNDLQYIHVFNMKPKDMESFDPYMPPSDLMVKSCCDMSEFYSEAPVRIKRGLNEFAEWHRHIYRYQTQRNLQGVVRRLPVMKTSDLIIMHPIECAIFDTNAKTIELMQKASMYWRCLRYNLKFNQVAVSSFSMLVSGIVNAAVNGGTKVFQELFLESELKDEPINAKFAQKLRESFMDQLKAVNFAIKVHERVMSEQYQGLHDNILESFEEMKKSMETAIGVVDLDQPPTFGEIPSTEFFKDLPKPAIAQIQAHETQMLQLINQPLQVQQQQALQQLSNDLL